MLLYSLSITPRLKYICDFIGKELCGQLLELTTDKATYENTAGPKINYTAQSITGDKCRITPHSLLFEKGIHPQVTECHEASGYKYFFKTDGDFPFDIFAASFYFLSRYEEYLPHQKDLYGRYAHENSLAYKQDFLNIPLINIWLRDFGILLQSKFPDFNQPVTNFNFLPTYDIDEAYSFKYKEWYRSSGAALKDLLKGRFARFALRRSVLNGKEPDPFDSYTWLDDLHRRYNLKSWYFFLVPEKTGKYDRNILPRETALQTLIRHHAEKYNTGLHPSWQSGDNTLLIKKEKETLEHITKLKVIASRQHFIRLTLPQTYRLLIDAGIRKEFSMGYGGINGFRASVASPFFWYDLEKEQATPLLLYPFCYMEANSFFEQKFSPQQALEEMRRYYNEVKKVNGTLITIWHNTFLGTDKLFSGWKDVYMQFVKEVSS